MKNFLVVFGAFFLIVVLWVVFGIIFDVNAELIAIPTTLFITTLVCLYFVKINQDKKIANFLCFVFWLSVLLFLVITAICGYVWLLGSHWAN
ncbi:MAG: hypothetical protein Q4B88_07060 [Moraxella sp.]|nr:hypothetical protein [Moraxella sp.]